MILRREVRYEASKKKYIGKNIDISLFSTIFLHIDIFHMNIDVFKYRCFSERYCIPNDT